MKENETRQQVEDIVLPPATPGWITPERVAHTLRVWQPYSEEPLTPEDAVGILVSTGKLFDALGLTAEAAAGGRR